MGSYKIVKVPRGTPLECTPELLKTSRLSVSKAGYSFKRNVACEVHEDSWIDRFDYNCPDCKTETVTYTPDDRIKFAVKCAEDGCTLREDCWCVDEDTLIILAAFRMTRERLV